MEKERNKGLNPLLLKLAPPVQISLANHPNWFAHSMGSGDAERFASSITPETIPEDVAKYFVAQLIRQKPNDEAELEEFHEWPQIESSTIESLSRENLSEIARQYLQGSKGFLKHEPSDSEDVLAEFGRAFQAVAEHRKEQSKKFLEKLGGSVTLDGLFGTKAVQSILKTQERIADMTKHARAFEIQPAHKLHIPPLPPNTDREILATLQYLSDSQNEQLDALLSQQQQQALQSDTLEAMNTSLVDLATGTATQASEAKRSARWAIFVAGLSCVIALSGIAQSYFQYKASVHNEGITRQETASLAESALRILESSVEQDRLGSNKTSSAIDRMTQEQSDIRLLIWGRPINELLEIERQQLKAIKETNYGEEAGKK